MPINIQELSARIRKRIDDNDGNGASEGFVVVSETTGDNLSQSINSVVNKYRNPVQTQTQQKGLVRSVVSGLPTLVGEELDAYLEREAEFNRNATFAQQAKRDLVVKPAKIVSSLGQMVAAGLSSVGKSALEVIYAPVVGKDEVRSKLRGDLKTEEFLFGGQTKSWQEIKDDIDTYTQNSDIATDWEKQYLGLAVASLGFAADATPIGGGKSRLGNKLVRDLVNESDVATVKTLMINAKVPREIVEDAAPAVARATDNSSLRFALKASTQKVLRQADEAAARTTKTTGTASGAVNVAEDLAPTPRTLTAPTPGPSTTLLQAVDNSDEVITKLANSTDTGEVVSILTPYGVADNVAQEVSEQLVKATEPEDITRILRETNTESPGTNVTPTGQTVNQGTDTTPPSPTSDGIRKEIVRFDKELDVFAREPKVPKPKPQQRKQISSADNSLKGVSPSTPQKTDTANINKYNRVRDKVATGRDVFLEEVQDEMIRVRKLVNDKSLKVSDKSNIYDAEIRFHGRVGTRLEDVQLRVSKIDKDVATTEKKLKLPEGQLTREINEFLITRHAPERNRALKQDGAAGIKTADAIIRRAEIRKLPYSKELIRIANDIQNLNNETLDILLGGGVIGDDLYRTLRKTYEYHVPLQRVMEHEPDFAGAIARGFDVTTTGVRRAKGSDKEVNDILGNVVYNYEQALIRAEKNRVDLTTLEFVRRNELLLSGRQGGGMREITPPIVPVANEPVEKLVDPVLHNKLLEFAKKNGIQVENKKRLGRGGRRLLGLATSKKKDEFYGIQMEDEFFGIKLRAASDEATFAHELGHIIDHKWEKFDERELVNLDDELVKIAETRASKELRDADPAFNAYLLKRNEKVAEAVSMFITAPELMSKIAPRTQKYLTKVFSSDKNLKEILTFKPSRERQIVEFQDTIFRPRPELLYNDPTVLVLREAGEQRFIKIEDPKLALALRGVARVRLGGVMRGVAAISRFYSGLHTRFNPEFAFSNKVRDVQEVLVYAAAQGEIGVKGSAKIAAREARLQNIGAVTDFLRGKDSEGAKLYRQMRQDGGTTGGLGLSTRKQVELDIDKIRKMNRSNRLTATQKILQSVDDWNAIFEDSSRLSVYRQALENGVSRQRAAVLAKESSVNFNKFGKQGQIINAFYIFSNASIQGTTKMIRAMKNPKVATTVTLATFGSVAAVAEWNNQVDPDWRNKMTTWDRLNSLAIMLPNSDPTDENVRYITIPVSWGIKPIKVMADQIYDLMSGEGEGVTEASKAVLVSMLEAYNPAGGSDVLSAITPTILDIPSDWARNRAWHGGAIKPDWDRNAPASIRYFDSLSDSTTGKISIGVSRGLSGIGIEISPADMHYSYEQLVGGAGRFVNKTVNTITAVGGEEPVSPKEVPVVSRFYKSRPIEEAGSGADEFQRIEELLQEQSRERFYENQEAEDSYQQLKNLPKEEAAEVFKTIIETNPDMAKKINKIIKDEEKGLTFVNRKILQLGVGNGERAKFLKDKFDGISSREKKAQLWNEYVSKGIISKEVAKQLVLLFKEE